MKKLMFITVILCLGFTQIFSQSLLDREKQIKNVLKEKMSPELTLEAIKNINSFFAFSDLKETKEEVFQRKQNEEEIILKENMDEKNKKLFLQESKDFFEKIILKLSNSSISTSQKEMSLAKKNENNIGKTNDITKKRELNTLDVERVRQRDEKRFSSTNATNENGYNGYVIFDLTIRCSNEYRLLQKVSFVIYEVDDKGEKLEGTSPISGDIKASEKRYFYLPDGLYKSEMTYKGKTWTRLFEVVSGQKTGHDNEGFSYEWRSRLEIYK